MAVLEGKRAWDPPLQMSVSTASEDDSTEDHSRDSLCYRLIEPQGLCKGNIGHQVGSSSVTSMPSVGAEYLSCSPPPVCGCLTAWHVGRLAWMCARQSAATGITQRTTIFGPAALVNFAHKNMPL